MEINKSIDISVVGLDVIDDSIAISEKNVFGVKEQLGKQEAKGSLKIFVKSMILAIAYLVLFTIVLIRKIYSVVVTLCCAIPPFIFLVMDALKKNTRKIQQQGKQADNERSLIAYMKNEKDKLQVLLDNKNSLNDLYLQNIEDGYYLSFVCSSSDENTTKQYNIFIDSLKFSNEGTSSTLTIEKYEQYTRRYRIILEIPYDIYDKIKTLY